MKQNITYKQLQELSETGWKNFKNYINSKQSFRSSKCIDYASGAPLLSIGQMIEFLLENANEIGMQYSDTGCDWYMWFGYNNPNKSAPYREDELCDALWEAVKKSSINLSLIV